MIEKPAFNIENLIKRINKDGNYAFVMLLGIFLVHCLFLLLFSIKGIGAMVVANAISVPLYLLILWLHWRGSYTISGLLTFLEIVAHQVCGYYFLGPRSGFDLLLLSLLFAQFTLLPRTRCQLAATFSVCLGSFGAYYLTLQGAHWLHSERFYTDAAYASAHEFTYPINLICLISYMLVYGAVANLSTSGRIDDLLNTLHKDFLTGLHNRKFLEERGYAAICQAASGGARGSARGGGKNGGGKNSADGGSDELYALFCIRDLDNFKRINDTFGHANGDLVLKYFAMLLQQSVLNAQRVGICACAGRWGGEEFVFSMHASLSQIKTTLEGLRTALCEHEFYEMGRVSATFGAALVKAPQLGACAKYLQAADEALYEGKNAGKNRVVLRHIDG